MEQKGTIFNIQHYSVHDGPGIRTVVFFKGCPLRCLWCANPESQLPEKQLAWKQAGCIGCGGCVKDLSRFGVHFARGGLFWEMPREEICEDEIRRVCPAEALHVIGVERTVGEVLELVEKDAVFYGNSGGGLTVSGGEPLMQPEFLIALLKEAGRRHIHRTMETSGYAKWEVFCEAAAELDYLLMDIKCMDDDVHRRFTGVSNQLILENLKKVRDTYPQLPIHVRTPVIPGVNDSGEALLDIRDFLDGMPGITYELLKYHRLGIPKYESLRREYPMEETSELSEEQFKQLQTIVYKGMH